LSELLLEKGYNVYGLIRRSSTNTKERINHLLANPKLHLVEGDITDASCMFRIISGIKPDEIYHLAAQSNVGVSFVEPYATFQTDAMGTLNILEAIRQTSNTTKMYFAGTSELFGDVRESPQNEGTEIRPRSPYAVAKAAGYYSCRLYREAYGVFGCTGILFNHSSPRRGEDFVTRKITMYIARLLQARQHNKQIDKLKLGSLTARRDWGHARDYVEAMWLILQQEKPDDFVIASGKTWSIKQLLEEAFGVVGLNWEDHVGYDAVCSRPADVELLCGDASKAKRIIGWEPKTTFHELIREMVIHDCRQVGIEING
jgi:GDPmannose 4,6-dehydratase